MTLTFRSLDPVSSEDLNSQFSNIFSNPSFVSIFIMEFGTGCNFNWTFSKANRNVVGAGIVVELSFPGDTIFGDFVGRMEDKDDEGTDSTTLGEPVGKMVGFLDGITLGYVEGSVVGVLLGC